MTLVATMVKKKPDFKVPITFFPEKEKEEETKDKSVAVKLTTNLEGAPLPNPTTDYSKKINQGNVEQYFKWKKVLSDTPYPVAI
jgi:hypothetical protein